jgi:hypothetical protein
MERLLSRRAFTAGMGLTGLAGFKSQGAAKHKTIDAHEHLSHHSDPRWAERDRELIELADKLGIDQLCCSILSPHRPATVEEFRQCNDWTAEAMRKYPGRVLGYCFVNPGFVKEARDEVSRCVEKLGFMGVKLYNDYVATEPVLAPLVEHIISLRVPLLQHAGHGRYEPAQPRISDGGVLAELGNRYPELLLICAHVTGGGDWEWTIKALRDAPSVYLDISGSVIDEGVVEMAVQVLGGNRILFACDTSFLASVGRIRSAELSDADRTAILGGNMERILSKRRVG